MRAFIRSVILFLSYLFWRNHDSKIIYYHDVGMKYTEMGTELDVIKRHANIAKREKYVFVPEIDKPTGQLMVCFDDGWAGIYEAKDFFIRNNIFPTIFVAVDLINSPGYLSLEQIKEMQSLGFRFEGHSWSHYDLTTYDDAGLLHEVKDSKDALSKMLGKEIKSICFPQGRFSDAVVRCCQDAGYSKLYSSISGGYYDLLGEKSLICRNLVQSVTDRQFKYIIDSKSSFFVKRTMKLHYQR